MCETCGCAVTLNNTPNVLIPHSIHTHDTTAHDAEHKDVAVLRHLLHANQQAAHHNRDHLNQHGVLTINLMSSPGAGKTSLLEATIVALRTTSATFPISPIPPKVAVIEGDLETERDAERIRCHGVPAVQITTGSACHLDAKMVHNALHDLQLAGLNYLFIENVGNLVCPASFDLGQHRNVVLLSTPEGDDKPAKYPVMFRTADLVLVTKCDLLPVLNDFATEQVCQHMRALANPAPVLEISARTGAGLNQWLDWLTAERLALAQNLLAPLQSI